GEGCAPRHRPDGPDHTERRAQFSPGASLAEIDRHSGHGHWAHGRGELTSRLAAIRSAVRFAHRRARRAGLTGDRRGDDSKDTRLEATNHAESRGLAVNMVVS